MNLLFAATGVKGGDITTRTARGLREVLGGLAPYLAGGSVLLNARGKIYSLQRCCPDRSELKR